jgi:hypothetical protein
MMFLQGGGDMMFPLSLKVCLVGFFSSFKRAKVQALSAGQADPRLKLAAYSGNTKQAGRVVGSRSNPILSVFLVGNNAQVGNPVVVADGVDVVNKPVRPTAVNVKPRKTMRSVFLPKNSNADIAVGHLCPRNLAFFGGSSLIDKPNENARIRVVMQKVFKLGLGDSISGFSHVIAPFQRWIGQRIEGVTSTFFPRFNIEGIA